MRGCGRRITRGGRGKQKRKDLGWKWRAEAAEAVGDFNVEGGGGRMKRGERCGRHEED